MNFLTTIINALVRFVQRNPLTVLIIVVLAIGAPALLKGVALFFLYFMFGILILGLILVLLFRRRVNKVRRQMEEQFGQGFGGQDFGAPFAGEARREREGEVKVYKTSETPEKRVSKSVGDYVEFEETTEE